MVTAAYLAWVFVWDDEIDLGETETSRSVELGREYCEKSLAYIKASMGLGDSGNGAETLPYPCMEIFREFGHGLRAGADEGQCSFSILVLPQRGKGDHLNHSYHP